MWFLCWVRVWGLGFISESEIGVRHYKLDCFIFHPSLHSIVATTQRTQ